MKTIHRYNFDGHDTAVIMSDKIIVNEKHVIDDLGTIDDVSLLVHECYQREAWKLIDAMMGVEGDEKN